MVSMQSVGREKKRERRPPGFRGANDLGEKGAQLSTKRSLNHKTKVMLLMTRGATGRAKGRIVEGDQTAP